MNAKYYRWLVGLVCDRYHAKYYTHLLDDLYEREFYWSIGLDEDRAIDGINLRDRFLDEHKSKTVPPMDEPCSVLEMMAALAIRMEREVRGTNSDYDGTSDWFWGMIVSLGLDRNDDGNYDADLTDAVLETFLERRYKRDGKGSLFTCLEAESNGIDMANETIWKQMNLYISELD